MLVTVLQITLVGEVHELRIVDKEHEGWRIDIGLCDVQDVKPPTPNETARRRNTAGRLLTPSVAAPARSSAQTTNTVV